MRIAAAEAVGNLSSAALGPYMPRLGRLLADADWRVRRTAVQAMAGRALTHVGPYLADIARLLGREGEEEGVQVACLTTLGTLPPAEAVLPFCDTVVRLLRRRPGREAHLAAVRTLAKLPWPGLAPYLDELVATALHSESIALRRAALSLLASLPLDAGAAPFADEVATLVSEAAERSPSVRAMALDVLVGLPLELLRPHRRVLQAAARHDSDGSVRSLASRVLQPLLREGASLGQDDGGGKENAAAVVVGGQTAK